MKIKTIILSFLLLATARTLLAQTSPKPIQSITANNPWTDKQLVEPAALALLITRGKAGDVIIYNIGAVEDIKGARHIGPVSNLENLKKLETAVSGLPKNKAIIIYCGCCPFVKCPNIRPAFIELIKEGFTNIKLLNLPKNLQSNWIAQHYPMGTEQP